MPGIVVNSSGICRVKQKKKKSIGIRQLLEYKKDQPCWVQSLHYLYLKYNLLLFSYSRIMIIIKKIFGKQKKILII